jgi:hypothetical protein
MSKQFPKLKAKLNDIQTRLNEVLKTEFIDKEIIENVEMSITTSTFVVRSPKTNAVLALVNPLKALKVADRNLSELTIPLNIKKQEEIKKEVEEIKKKHVLTAKSLLKIHNNEELATHILIAAMHSSDEEVLRLAIEALGEFGQNEETVSDCEYIDEGTNQGKWTKDGIVYESERACIMG